MTVSILLILVVSLVELFDPNSHSDPLAATFDLIFPGLIIAGLWGVFRKAGRPGWAAIVPIST